MFCHLCHCLLFLSFNEYFLLCRWSIRMNTQKPCSRSEQAAAWCQLGLNHDRLLTMALLDQSLLSQKQQHSRVQRLSPTGYTLENHFQSACLQHDSKVERKLKSSQQRGARQVQLLKWMVVTSLHFLYRLTFGNFVPFHQGQLPTYHKILSATLTIIHDTK